MGQVLFQFKKFPVKQLEFMTELQGAENPRFWFPFITLSGLYGLPGIEGLKNMINSVFDYDIELEYKDHLIRWAGEDEKKKAIAKTVMYGAFSNDQLGGVDLSHRIGAGDFIPSQTRDLLGPFFSSSIRAMQMAAKEEWVEVLRSIGTAPGNLALALKNDGELISPWDRNRLTTKLDTRGRILKGLGFATTQETIERDTSRIMRNNQRDDRNNELEAIDAYIKAEQSGDERLIDAAINGLAENGITAKRVREEMGRKGMTRSERAFDNLPKKGKSRDLPLVGFGQ